VIYVPRDTAPVEGTSGAATWDHARELAGRWFQPLTQPDTWRAAAYLATGLLTTSVWFLVVGVTVTVAAVAALTVVGVLLLIPAFGVVAWCSGLERRRAGMVGAPVAPRRTADADGLWRGVRVRVGDPTRWRQVGYQLTALFVAWTLALVAVVAWGAVGYLVSLPLWGWAVGLSLPAALVLAVLGIAASPVAARVVGGCGRLEAAYARWLLGPDRYAAMQSQVEHLTADRLQIIDAVAGERRRIERNLHDGVQARLVALGIDLGMAEAVLPDRPDRARDLVAAAREKNRASIAELREIGRGLHPAILGDRGLDAALSAVVAASPVPMRLTCSLDVTPPPAVEEAAYFIVSEAVSNILKHARARSGSVVVEADAHSLRITVHDDGLGGADATRGSGLAGIEARVRALDGALRIASPPGGPTVLAVELPLATTAREALR
jgi:signal transduction histidine kinase